MITISIRKLYLNQPGDDKRHPRISGDTPPVIYERAPAGTQGIAHQDNSHPKPEYNPHPGTREEKSYTESVEDVLKQVYFDCEYIDPEKEVIEKIINEAREPVSIPYGIYRAGQAVGFFTIDLSNPPVLYDAGNPRCCWLDSFIIGQAFQKKRYATALLKQLPGMLQRDFPHIENLNLTVNYRNKGAQALYLKCGFIDTGKTYTGGPSGPQYIYTLPVVDSNLS